MTGSKPDLFPSASKPVVLVHTGDSRTLRQIKETQKFKVVLGDRQLKGLDSA